jgi:hypothetical protein
MTQMGYVQLFDAAPHEWIAVAVKLRARVRVRPRKTVAQAWIPSPAVVIYCLWEQHDTGYAGPASIVVSLDTTNSFATVS